MRPSGSRAMILNDIRFNKADGLSELAGVVETPGGVARWLDWIRGRR